MACGVYQKKVRPLEVLLEENIHNRLRQLKEVLLLEQLPHRHELLSVEEQWVENAGASLQRYEKLKTNVLLCQLGARAVMIRGEMKEFRVEQRILTS